MKQQEAAKQKQEEAKKRQTIRNKRTDTQQLDIILNRPGNSTKEKTRLLKRMERRHDKIK